MTSPLPDAQSTRLARRLGTTDAVLIGVGAMWGAGIFTAFAPAAAAVGRGLAWALILAAFIAFANATSSAQLAAKYPASGGTYVYGREEIGHTAGFLAGWCFVIGKTASCAAMALTAAAYLTESGPEMRLLAALLVVALVAINYRGVTKTALVSRVIVALVALILASVSALSLSSPAKLTQALPHVDGGITGTLAAAGFLFFAFAGYARIATLGEEVRQPRHTIPRAITIALLISVATYALVALALMSLLSPAEIAASAAPLARAAEAGGWFWLVPFIRVGAVLAACGALMALIAGVGRTMFAMASNHDLPQWLAAVHPRFHVPHRAELVQGAIIIALVLSVDLRGAIGFSSFGVLTYYAIANIAAWRQTDQRRYPRALQLAGLVGCVTVSAFLPWTSVLAGLVLIAIGLLVRHLSLRRI